MINRKILSSSQPHRLARAAADRSRVTAREAEHPARRDYGDVATFANPAYSERVAGGAAGCNHTIDSARLNFAVRKRRLDLPVAMELGAVDEHDDVVEHCSFSDGRGVLGL